MTAHFPHPASPVSDCQSCGTSASQLPAGDLIDAGGAFWDASEALVNSVIGLCVSWAATFFVLGYSPTESAAITGMFFALSFSRAWIVRRIFRGLS